MVPGRSQGGNRERVGLGAAGCPAPG